MQGKKKIDFMQWMFVYLSNTGLQAVDSNVIC